MGEGTDDLDDLRPLNQSDSLLSPSGGQKLMNEAIQAVNGEKYDVAMDKLQQARKIFNQLSNFHLQLANSFSGIDQKVFEEQRSEALKTGQMRDEATYRLALVHRAKNQPELAVPLLIQIIRSQNPTTDLGKKSYQQLLELGFVATPFAPSNPGSTPVPNPSSNPPPAK
jgi:thioredoxin-like negative regulator of GroEL